MQGIIVTPAAMSGRSTSTNDKVVYMPKGDPSKAKFYCQSTDGKPNKDSPCKLNGPFHLAIDQQDRIWITNAIGDTVTRFPASDPSKVEVFPTGGHSGKGMAIDSKGNAWITNTLGSGLTLETKVRLLELKLAGDSPHGDGPCCSARTCWHHPGLGSVSMLRPDGSPAPGSPFNPGSIWGAWAVSIDGNDHVWISNFAPGGGITELCGARTETCPPGMKTGDADFAARRLQGRRHADAGRCLHRSGRQRLGVQQLAGPRRPATASPTRRLSTRCGGQGMTVFYGMAKPVRAPQIGPARQP